MNPRAVDTNTNGQCWNTHHLTCHAVTISYLTWCKREVWKCAPTQPSAWIAVLQDYRWGCFWLHCLSTCVYQCEKEGGGHLPYGAVIRYSTWYDIIWWYRSNYGMGLCEKCDDRASGRLDCDLTSGGRQSFCMRERKGENGNELREMRGDAVKEGQEEWCP